MFEPFNGTFAVNEIDSAIDVDAIIVGAPFEDQSKIYPFGASLAPHQIRKNSMLFSGQSFSQQNIHQLNVLDFGDLKDKSTYNEVIEQLADKVQNIVNKKAVPIILGGDHSIALGTIKGLMGAKQKFDGLVWVDAHLDLMNEYPKKMKYSRATVLRRIFEQNYFHSKDIYILGARGHNLGLEEIAFLEEKKMNVLDMEDYGDEKKQDHFLKNLKNNYNHLYVSIDFDALDPAFAPGVSVPEPGGLSTLDLIKVITILAPKIKCFELVEVNPKLDVNDLTSKVACKIIFEFLDFK